MKGCEGLSGILSRPVLENEGTSRVLLAPRGNVIGSAVYENNLLRGDLSLIVHEITSSSFGCRSPFSRLLVKLYRPTRTVLQILGCSQLSSLCSIEASVQVLGTAGDARDEQAQAITSLPRACESRHRTFKHALRTNRSMGSSSG